MGKPVFNAKKRKARRNPETIVDNSSLKNIKLDLDAASTATNSGTGYDDANALVLPSKKRDTKIKLDKKQNVRILSKKQRKHLQSIVDKRKKKDGRAELLQQLAHVQIPADELQQYTSISQVQTMGVKKLQNLDDHLAKRQRRQTELTKTRTACVGKISSIKGAAKRHLLLEEQEEMQLKRKNPNVVGLDDDPTEATTTDTDTDEEPEEENTRQASPKVEEPPPPVARPKPIESERKPIVRKVQATPCHTTVFVPVHRNAEVQAARLKLPILAEEQVIMETINENAIVIMAGETGSGKTTQIPQFLYEAGYAQNSKLIGITEPRRVAAIAMSKRVAMEMNLSEREVSYLIRFEGNVTPQTRIKFMTDGVLLKEIESDFLLHNYSAIVLDEAHERSAYTDILVGLLSRIVPLRAKRGLPLKLIIMSATLRVEDFISNARLFKQPPPLLTIEARQFPVTMHFQRRTPANYVDAALSKTIRIHAQLPEGGILIFLTGQLEVNQLVRKLRRRFPYVRPSSSSSLAEQKAASGDDASANEEEEKHTEFDMRRAIRNVRKSKKKFVSQIALPKIDLDDYKLPGDDTEADLLDVANSDKHNNEDNDDVEAMAHEDDDDQEEDDDEDEDEAAQLAATTTRQPLWVLPLYSLLSTEKQNRIFKPAPEGCRLCVVSTNIAETSLTIPNIKYVVDSGRQKTRLYDKVTGVSAFVVTYTSKASADQRAGRAGRVSAGHCYRLYSSAVYNDEFLAFGTPDIQKKPVDDLMLQMRCMGIDRVVNFPFPSPPDALQLAAAEQRLIVLGALEPVDATTAEPPKRTTAVTRLGAVIAGFPVAPRYGKMLALSQQQQLLPYTVCLVAALSVPQLLLECGDTATPSTANGGQALRWQRKRLAWAASGNYQLLGDPMVLLRAIGGAEYASAHGKLLTQFCLDNGLRHKAVLEVRQLRRQITNEINLHVNDASLCVDPLMPPPTDAQARFLRQILLAGMGDRVARKVPLADISDKAERRRLKYAYNLLDVEEPAHMHSGAVLRHKQPEWVVYQEAYETANGDSTKMFISGITAIEPEWLLLYVPQLCNVRCVRDDPPPKYSDAAGKIYAFVEATYGRAAWPLPPTQLEMPLSEKACSYFGMFLLDGQICPRLAELKPKLKSTPSALIKNWSNLNESVVRFKRALVAREINTRDRLFEAWQLQPNFLLEEYHNMLYNISLAELTSFWPPLPENGDGAPPI